jgi:uncharacterized protein YmfQ (DUF2313 family)
MDKLLNALSQEYARVHSEIAGLISYVRLTEDDYVLSRWESFLGLSLKSKNNTERQERVAFWLNPPSSMSREVFERYLRVEGFTNFEITDNLVRDDGAYDVGSEKDDSRFKILIRAKDCAAIKDEFEALLRKVKPAHVIAEIKYEELGHA